MDTPKKVLISYSHDTKAHAARVRGLADSLCRDGVDSAQEIVDQGTTIPLTTTYGYSSGGVER